MLVPDFFFFFSLQASFPAGNFIVKDHVETGGSCCPPGFIIALFNIIGNCFLLKLQECKVTYAAF